MIHSLLLLVFIAQPIPCDGPALDLAFLKTCRLDSVTVSSSWRQGLYQAIFFRYISKKPLSEVVRLYQQDAPNAKRSLPDINAYPPEPPKVETFEWNRKMGAIHQSCCIDIEEVLPQSTTKPERLGERITVISLFESVDTNEGFPNRWYRKAIASAPPVPMIKVPFLASTTTDEVRFGNEWGWRSPTASSDDDEAHLRQRQEWIFDAHIKQPYKLVIAKADRWLKKQGYKQSSHGVYLKDHADYYKYHIYADSQSPRQGTCVVIYHQKKKPKSN